MKPEWADVHTKMLALFVVAEIEENLDIHKWSNLNKTEVHPYCGMLSSC